MSKALSYIEISKSNLLHNIRSFKNLIPKDTKLAVVVKANAYGHGLKEVVSVIQNFVDYFQVDDIEELREIRLYTKKPVLVFGYIQNHDLEEAVDLGGILGVYDKAIIKKLNLIGKTKNKKIKIHLKFDALLGRQGILFDQIEEYGNFIKKLSYIDLVSVYSHFSNIEDSENLSHAQAQWAQLIKAKEILSSIGFLKISHHISATSGLLTNIDMGWQGSIERLGIGMYGQWPSKGLEFKFSKKIKIKPVLRWISHLAQVKKIPKDFPVGYGLTFVSKKIMNIAVVPQGYSDGYDRGFSNNGYVLVRGKKCSVIGRVAMNMFVVDISGVKDAKSGDEIILIGSQGRYEITAESLADRIGTINYEILARISPKLPRVVKK